MPHYFPNTIRAMIAGRAVRMAHMVEFDFDSVSGFDPVYLWNGSRTITSGGHDWVGLRGLGSISGIDEVSTITSSTIKATLSGLDTAMMGLAVSEDKTHYLGRLLRVWLQFFDADFQIMDDPYARCAGLMDGMEVTRSQGADGATVRSISVTAPNIFFGRVQSPIGYYTDSDQKKKSPGDRGCEFIPDLVNSSIAVPWLAGFDTP